MLNYAEFDKNALILHNFQLTYSESNSNKF